MFLCKAGLKKPFLRSSITSQSAWTYKKKELPKTFRKIHELKSQLLNVFFEKRNGQYSAIVQTKE